MNHRRSLLFLALTLALGCAAGLLGLAHAAQLGADRPAPAHAPAAPGFGYVGFSSSDDLAVVDLDDPGATPLAFSLLPEGDYPYDVTISPDEQEIWIAGAAGDGILVVDGSSNSIVQRIAVPNGYPVDVMFSKDAAHAFIANRDTETIAVVDTSTYAVVNSFVISSVLATAPDPGKMALNACNGDIYIADWYDDYLFVIDPVTGATKAEMDAGSSLWDMVFSPDAQRLFVTDRSQDQVHVIDTAVFSLTNSIPTGDDPWGIDITPDGKLLFVANEDSHDVTVIDAETETVITTIPLPSTSADPRDLDISADGKFAYLPSGDLVGPDAVYILDTALLSITGVINFSNAVPGVTANPNALAVAPELNNLEPVPAFTTTAPVNLGTPVYFFDASLNNPTSWQWDFGDGLGNSTQQNPVYNYLNPGSYDVTLTVGSACGSRSITHTVQVIGATAALDITKRAPATAAPGAPVTYTLTVTNSGTAVAANLVITDRLPAGAAYVSGGTLAGDVVSWAVPSLAPNTAVTVHFVVTATATLTNAHYGASAAGGITATGATPVTTLIRDFPAYLPAIRRP